MFTYCNTKTGVTFLSACECAGADIVRVSSENDVKSGKNGGGKNGKNTSSPTPPK